MVKKIGAVGAVLALLLSLFPVASSASSTELSIILSPDEFYESTVDVAVCVKSSLSVSTDGIYAYFTYDSSKLTPLDTSGSEIDFGSFSSGATFNANKVTAVSCTSDWSDDSSFIKTISGNTVVGLELAPAADADVSDGVPAGFIRLKIKNGDYSAFDTQWITPVTEKIGAMAFPSAVFTSSGKLEPTLSKSYSDEFKQLTCAHDWGETVSVAPLSGKDGKIYYKCSKCALTTAVDCNASGELSPHSRNSVSLQDLSADSSTAIPSAATDKFDLMSTEGSSIYDYSSRGAAIRCSEQTADGTADMRFAASVTLPDLSAAGDAASSYKLVDFGFIYCLSDSILKSGSAEADENASKLSSEKITAQGLTDGVNVYGVECAKLSFKELTDAGKVFNYSTYDADGKYTGSSANSNAKPDSAKYLTFNLVINIAEKNYERFYAVRPYVTYSYLGSEFTLYDCDDSFDAICSSRSVKYVAGKAYNSQSELQSNKDYIYEKILSLYV